MNALFQIDFLVALLAIGVAAALIVALLGRTEDPLGDEMAQCVRQSAELLDSCAHSIDGRPLDETAFGDLSGGRWRTPGHPFQLSQPAGDPGAATRIGAPGC
jgi:hypothetical protein